jgi:hypothetical protein
VDVAFEQRLRVASSAGAGGAAGVLPTEAPAPFRVAQLDWQFASSDRAEWRGEIDRAALHLHTSRGDITIGRQAVGWGRGALFGAIDLFAPFTPLEADREWRRGVDAVRADVKLADRVSLDSVAALGTSIDASIFASRLRGYAGKIDLEGVGGYRAGDLFGGVTSSAAVAGIELHGEVALFRTDATPGSLVFSDRRSVVKAVGGGSYRVPLANGILLFVEYHYSGFGAASSDRITTELSDAAFQERYLRGDTQILGRHAVAALASYEYSPELSVAATWIHSPRDASGVIVPSATWTISDALSLVVNAYVPYGEAPVGPALRSEYGAAPTAVFAQVRLYR